jgi:integral membrane protein (TIGR01906 family)
MPTKQQENKILQMLFIIALSLFIILTCVKLTLMFKPLYYFDIQNLNIEAQAGFSREEITKNYNYVINYLLSPKSQAFRLPSIPYSKYGQIHFRDVKRIFTTIDILLIAFGVSSICGLLYNLKRKIYGFLNKTAYTLVLLPAVLLAGVAINFDAAFVIFHKIFFRNDYWQFDPELDPIITILPQEFFLHSALMIVILIILSIIALKISYKVLTKRKQA